MITATALDRDQGLNGTVWYSLDPEVSARYPGVFSLNQNTGRITTLQTLDREQYSEFDIILRARDQGTPVQTSTATIHLNVSDVNDNAPVFYPVHYYVRVAESEPTHTSVIQVMHVYDFIQPSHVNTLHNVVLWVSFTFYYIFLFVHLIFDPNENVFNLQMGTDCHNIFG